MIVDVKQNREVLLTHAQNTQNENEAEKITLIVPEQYSTFNKKIVFITPDGIFWDIIVNNEYLLTKAITKYKQIEFYIWLTKGDEDFRTKTKTLRFYTNEEVDPLTPEEIDGVNTVINLLEEEIAKVNALELEIDGKLEDVNTAIAQTNNLNLDANKVGKTTTVTLTKKDNTTKTVQIADGINLQFTWEGTSLGIKTEDQENYTFVDLQGVQGPVGPQGEAFKIKKTYATVQLMIADYDNMEINDYVMISGNIEQEDNAKLFTKTETEDPTYRWQYLGDFSGATGIQGPTGLTPNIQIGSVQQGASFNVTRTGTNENPILNFTLVKGDKGDTGETGATGETGNGISSIEKTGTSGLVDTYTITYTDGTTTTFTVTNGEDGEVTQTQFDELEEKVEMLEDLIPTDEAEGESIDLSDSAEYYFKEVGMEGQTSQESLPDEYQAVEYIESTGTQRIDTGVVGNVTWKLKAQGTGTSNIVQVMLGRSADNGHWFGILVNSNTYGTGAVANTNIPYNTIIEPEITFTTTNIKLILNGTEYNREASANHDNAEHKLFYVDNSFYTKMKLYYAKCYQNNILIREYIPCYRKSDDVIGMYDLVTKTFYTNSGTGTFDKGNDISLPNPSYPFPINNTIGDNKIFVDTGNILDLSQPPVYNPSADKVSYNEPILTLKKTASNINACVIFKIGNVNDIGNKKIYINGKKADNLSYKIMLGYADNDGNNREMISTTEESRSNTNFSLNMTVDSLAYAGKIVIVWFYLNRGAEGQAGDISKFSDVIVSVGASRNYVPYKTPQTVTFPLSSGQYMAEGDYLADDGIHHKWGQYTFDGKVAEDWGTDGTNKFWLTPQKLSNLITTNYKDGISYFNYLKYDENYYTTEYTGGIVSSKAMWIYFGSNQSITGVNNLRTYLSEHNLTMQYQLATETIEPYTPAQQEAYDLIQKLKSYKGTTYISQTNDGEPFNLKVVYRKDTTNLINTIDSLEARIEALENRE